MCTLAGLQWGQGGVEVSVLLTLLTVPPVLFYTVRVHNLCRKIDPAASTVGWVPVLITTFLLSPFESGLILPAKNLFAASRILRANQTSVMASPAIEAGPNHSASQRAKSCAPLNSSVRLQMKIKIRAAEQSDATVAVDVVRRSIQQLCVADHQGDPSTIAMWLANKTPENFLLWLANPDNFCVVAESGDRLSGVGLLHRSGEIRLFYLAPGAQRQGIGRMIHAELEVTARRWELSSLHLHSTAMARPFYEALGYHSTGAASLRFGVLECFPYAMPLQPDHPSERMREKPRVA